MLMLRFRVCRHTLAGSPWHLKLVHEAAELLSHSHGPL